MFAVIPQTWPFCNRGAVPDSTADLEWLPRSCPACGGSVIGHGRRDRQAHDEHHSRIQVRRGICKRCGKTITVLPAWLLSYTHYTLYARRQAVNRWLDGARGEETAPIVEDPDRIADPATLRRWAARRWQGLCAWLAGWRARGVLPTILAWDWQAAARMLIPEAKPA
jgi:hypothetical protein